MTADTDETRTWKRLGELLTRRRVALDPRYHNRRLFCDERQINYRLVYDIELAKRADFAMATLAAVAQAYAVTFESIQQALDGGELEPIPEAAKPAPRFQVLPGGAGQVPGETDARDLSVFDVLAGPIIRELWETIEKARAANPDASGRDIFPSDQTLADIWDMGGQHVPVHLRLNDRERLRPMAAYVLSRRGEAGRAG